LTAARPAAGSRVRRAHTMALQVRTKRW
jgi:hypothetical protein